MRNNLKWVIAIGTVIAFIVLMFGLTVYWGWRSWGCCGWGGWGPWGIMGHGMMMTWGWWVMFLVLGLPLLIAIGGALLIQRLISTPGSAKAIHCPNCQRSVQVDWRHCPHCGTILRQ